MNKIQLEDMAPQVIGEILPPLPTFDYSALAPEAAAHMRDTADRIRMRHRQHVAAIIETGRDLLAVKQRLLHGQFGAWLQAEFSMTERTALNYMRTAAEFGGKSEIVSDLPPAALYTLVAPSTPASVKQAVIERLETGDRVTSHEVRDLVREAKVT